ncbi:putative plasmid-related transcriptional repressor protein [Yersinia aldovae]|uniref:plasmid replication initiator TrfA n=1 Tax=Yersinia aldovae TaxID=29483 RepID=UPI0005DD80C2|nr:plasmid replication initiator TrfA [Yersinia aldovae]CNK14927.1 putative plasmid-related transcriptional repressor protein [Yersinia aldovae]
MSHINAKPIGIDAYLIHKDKIARLDKNNIKQSDRALSLPNIGESFRIMPNHIARSSLFAPVNSKNNLVYAGTTLVSRVDAVIKFWGEQLDESQADVWMQAMYEASKHSLGEPIVISRSKFLRAIGRNTSGANYEWLHRSMQCLEQAMFSIETNRFATGSEYPLHMIDKFEYDNEIKSHIFQIDPRWIRMYYNNEFSLVNWSQRLSFFHNQDIAKALQRLILTSNEQQQKHSLEWLKSKLIYTGRLRDFKNSIERAGAELKRVGIISDFCIEAGSKGKLQVSMTRLKQS